MVATRSLKHWFAGALMTFAVAHSALAVEVNGVKFDDTAKVAGKDLVLNGAGLRTKVIFKVYAAGLYLSEKKNTVADILRQDGPRRMTIVMLRDVSADDFGDAFMKGINENIDDSEKAKYAGQIAKFGELFGAIPGVKKGDVLHLDMIPGSGTQAELNGKKIGEMIPDPGFYNAVLRIWLGDKPVDRSLKPALMGAARS
jgi:Chalcone isomerase-like